MPVRELLLSQEESRGKGILILIKEHLSGAVPIGQAPLFRRRRLLGVDIILHGKKHVDKRSRAGDGIGIRRGLAADLSEEVRALLIGGRGEDGYAREIQKCPVILRLSRHLLKAAEALVLRPDGPHEPYRIRIVRRIGGPRCGRDRGRGHIDCALHAEEYEGREKARIIIQPSLLLQVKEKVVEQYEEDRRVEDSPVKGVVSHHLLAEDDKGEG